MLHNDKIENISTALKYAKADLATQMVYELLICKALWEVIMRKNGLRL